MKAMEKEYYILDTIRNGDGFGGDHPITAGTEEEAITKARTAWDALSDYDKARRESFTLVEAPANDGCADTDQARVIREFVNRSEAIQLFEVPMNTFTYRITGERAAEAGESMEKRIEVIEHERGYGHLEEWEYLTDLDEIPKDIEKEYGVTVTVVFDE